MNEIIPAEAVAEAVRRDYEVAVDGAELIRRGFNDTYRVDTDQGRLVARVYLAGKYYLRGDDDIRFELGMLVHLKGHGVPVSVPLPRRDAGMLGSITDAAESVRPYTLMTWADGDTVSGHPHPDSPTSFGTALAQVHTAAENFESPDSRYLLDASFLVDQPEREMAKRFTEKKDGRFEAYRDLFAEMRAFLGSQSRAQPDFGYVHGDPHGRNAHADDHGRVTLFDFDHSAFGWRAYDVLTAMSSVPEDRRDGFLAAYRAVRPDFCEDQASLSRWMPIRMLWDIGDMLAMAPVMGSDYNPPLDQGIAFLDDLRQKWDRAS